MELILIRHGTTQGNKEHRFIGVTDIPLIPEGEELARKIAPELPPVEHVYCSPLLRCRQTAELLWPEVEMTPVEQLRETDFGPFEGKNHEELKDDPLYQRWIAGGELFGEPVGESTEAVHARVREGLMSVLADAAAKGGQRVAIVAHGGTIMALMAQFGRPERDYYGWNCPNCGGYLVRVHQKPVIREVLSCIGAKK